MSLFYPLKLIGVGTRHIECCASYYIRLAEVHGLTGTELHRAMLFHDQNSSLPLSKSSLHSYLTNMPFINRVSYGSSQIHKLIHNLVGESNIHRSYLYMPILELSRFGKDIAAHDLRWCPLCLKEDIDSQATPYFRLIWQLRDITACEKHWVKLESRCPSCGRHQNQTCIPWRHLSKCRHCNNMLTESWSHYSESDIGSFFWGYSDIIETISKGKHYDIITIKENIQKAAIAKNESSAEHSKITHPNFEKAIRGDIRLNTTHDVFLACHSCDISIWEALNGKSDFAQLPLNFPTGQPYLAQHGYATKRGRPISPKKHKRAQLFEKHRQHISDLINNSEPPLTLRQLAAASNLSIRLIKHNWPNLVEKAKYRHQNYSQRLKIQTHIEAEKMCHQLITTLINDGIATSPTYVAKSLSKSTSIPFNTLFVSAKNILRDAAPSPQKSGDR